MEPDIEDAEEYCALQNYELTANCPNALIGEWKVTAANSLNEPAVYFSSPSNPVTQVRVPAQGLYFFQFECCS